MDCVAAWKDGGPADAVEQILQADGAVVPHAVRHAHMIALQHETVLCESLCDMKHFHTLPCLTYHGHALHGGV